VVKVDRRIRWHYTTTILRLRIGARLTAHFYPLVKCTSLLSFTPTPVSLTSGYVVPLSAGKRRKAPRYWCFILIRVCLSVFACNYSTGIGVRGYRSEYGCVLDLYFNQFLLNFYRAMLCIRGTSHGPVSVCLSVSVCVCVCLSQVGVLLKRLNIGSNKQNLTISQGL